MPYLRYSTWFKKKNQAKLFKLALHFYNFINLLSTMYFFKFNFRRWIIYCNVWKNRAMFLLVHTTNNGRRPSPLSWTSYSRRFQSNRQSQRRYNFVLFICLWNIQSSHALISLTILRGNLCFIYLELSPCICRSPIKIEFPPF